MADVAAFSTLLGRLGFNPPTVTHIVGQNLATIDALQLIPTTELDAMMQHISKWKPPVVTQAAGAAAPQQVQFPFLAVRQLKALRAWCDYRVLRGEEATPASFNNAAIARFMARLTELEEAARERKDDDDKKPPASLATLAGWATWEEEFNTYLGQHRSVLAGTPLTYVIRTHEEVTAPMLAKVYDSVDDDLIETTELVGTSFGRDNKRVFDLIKPLVLKGSGWSSIQPFNKTRDGRGAYKALKTQSEGRSAIATRKAQAYSLISTARYTGKGKTFSIDQYVARHQRAHNELLDLQEPVAESKKVVDFLAGITDPKLETAKAVIDGDTTKLTNFEECQQYIKTASMNAAVRATTGPENRIVAGLGQDNKQKRKKKAAAALKSGDDDDHTPSGVKIHAGKYDSKEYNKLKPFERAEVKRLREERDPKRTRTVATVASEADEQLQDGEVDPPNVPKNAGGQFGRAAHQKKK